MNVSDPTVDRCSSATGTRSGKVTPPDRFSEILRKKRKRDEETMEEVANLQTALGPAAGLSSCVPAAPDVASGSDSPASVSPSRDIEQLAAEMVDAIQLSQSPDGTRSIDLSFNSKTLEGLRVRIQSRNGELAIQFATQSEGVTKMLAEHSEGLSEALQSRGLRVARISVSRTSGRAGSFQMTETARWRGR